MKFITHIEQSKFDTFVKVHPKGHFLQTPAWGEFKSLHDWELYRVGVEVEGKLVATALILSRKLPFIRKSMFYIPRGFVMDYEDESLLTFFTNKLKAFAKSKGAFMIKIDPDIILQERDIEGNIIEGGKTNFELVKTLQSLGYVHKGTGLNFSGVQPRFSFRLDISKSEDEVFNLFHPKTRYNIRLAEKKGIEIIEGTREDLVRFTEIMEVTGKRDGFLTRPLSYFQEMFDSLYPNGQLKVFLARYNIHSSLEKQRQHLKNTEKKLKKAETNNTNKQTFEHMQKLKDEYTSILLKVEELEALTSSHPEGLIISGAILLKTGDKAWYLYGASDNIYRNLMPNYLLQWEMIKWAKNNDCDMYDFRGISGDLSETNPLYGLYRFKKGFNGEFTEFIGEFDLVVNKFIYFAWETLLPKFKKARRKLLQLRKKSH